MQTRSQQYAAKIYEQVKAIKKDESEDAQKKYGSMAHKLPILVRTAGLAQALAFVEARANPSAKKLLEHLAETLGSKTSEQLRTKTHQAELHEYIHLTQKTMNALVWYKRFAQSVLGVEQSQAPDITDGAES